MRRNDEVEHDDMALLGENTDYRDPYSDSRTTQAMIAVTLYTNNTPGGRFPCVGITERPFFGPNQQLVEDSRGVRFLSTMNILEDPWASNNTI